MMVTSAPNIRFNAGALPGTMLLYGMMALAFAVASGAKTVGQYLKWMLVGALIGAVTGFLMGPPRAEISNTEIEV